MMIEINPIEDFYKGKATVKFKPVLVHPNLWERLIIYFPLNKGLKTDVKFGLSSIEYSKK